MAVPKQKKIKSQCKQRRIHLRLKEAALTNCTKCRKPVLPHSVCKNCGYYKGREVLDVLKKLTKKERKKREKEMKVQEREKTKEKSLNWEDLSRK